MLLAEKLTIEPHLGQVGHTGKGQPHALVGIDLSGHTKATAEAHASGEITEPAFVPATGKGYLSGRWQRLLRSVQTLRLGPLTACERLIFPGTAKTNAMRIHDQAR